ncbi:hypothetical protein SAMN05878071_1164 [Pseudoalteromonas marina]|nr:hypothetical protein SAMN05878071_1164 [Pseudoalteromonas marina]
MPGAQDVQERPLLSSAWGLGFLLNHFSTDVKKPDYC